MSLALINNRLLDNPILETNKYGFITWKQAVVLGIDLHRLAYDGYFVLFNSRLYPVKSGSDEDILKGLSKEPVATVDENEYLDKFEVYKRINREESTR